MIVLSGPGHSPCRRPRPRSDATRRSWPRSRPRRRASPTPSARPSSTGAAAACCAGTRSCASWSPGPTCRRRRGRRHLSGARPREPLRRPAVPLRQPALRRARLQLRSVAQFEALKVAWFYKYLYNRPSPSKVDSGIQALMPDDRPARLSVRRRRPLGRHRRAAEAALPHLRGGDHAQGRRAAGSGALSGKAAAATSPPGSPWARRSRPCSPRARRRTECGPRAARRPRAQALANATTARGEIRGTAWRRRLGRRCSRCFGQVRPG